MQKFPISKKIQQFSQVFTDNGHTLYVVGGAVRDYLLGINISDYDFCTDALPEQVMSIFSHVIPTGIKHGTVTVLFKDEQYEVTTFRTESNYSDSRHPDSVNFVKSLNEDLSRRDFTINAFAANCRDGQIIDLFNGTSDLKNGIIRAIGDPKLRFSEDALRMLRMCRFAAKLKFKVDSDTFNSAKIIAENIKSVSNERIFEELDKTLLSEVPSIGFELMQRTNLLQYIIPELSVCEKTTQDKVGSNNVFKHILNAVDAASYHHYNNTVKWALLLHDIGKPQCMKVQNGFIRFYSHDVIGADLARTVLQRLKCSNYLTDTVSILIANHMIKYNTNWTDGAVKRFINRVGLENLNMLFELQWCDQIASEGLSRINEYDELIQRIEKLKHQPLSVKDLAVTGEDLAQIGIPRNREMGELLNFLLEMVLDYPTLNNKETLLKQAELHRQV